MEPTDARWSVSTNLLILHSIRVLFCRRVCTVFVILLFWVSLSEWLWEKHPIIYTTTTIMAGESVYRNKSILLHLFLVFVTRVRGNTLIKLIDAEFCLVCSITSCHIRWYWLSPPHEVSRTHAISANRVEVIVQVLLDPVKIWVMAAIDHISCLAVVEHPLTLLELSKLDDICTLPHRGQRLEEQRVLMRRLVDRIGNLCRPGRIEGASPVICGAPDTCHIVS